MVTGMAVRIFSMYCGTSSIEKVKVYELAMAAA